MRIEMNGKGTDTSCRTVMQLHDALFPDADVMILNGYRISCDVRLNENDQIYFGKSKDFPDIEGPEMITSTRDSTFVHERLGKATVGIAGLGGLGSNIAAMLARSGIGCLVIADFDTVEPTNLNRQNYYIDSIGMNKTDSTENILLHINPFVKVDKHCTKIDENNAADIFGECDVVCEAFDSPSAKAMLVNTLLTGSSEIVIVSGSGMGGYYDSNIIRTEKRMERLYVCGDNVNGDTTTMVGLMAPRVNICAGHMA
ncbi:MAG: sulfur carrier protein ThiS adenylyltransferase ThiF, partial [Candidatus Methanomethylophilaceae archaeon]